MILKSLSQSSNDVFMVIALVWPQMCILYKSEKGDSVYRYRYV